jgi:hypothetical protein
MANGMVMVHIVVIITKAAQRLFVDDNLHRHLHDHLIHIVSIVAFGVP